MPSVIVNRAGTAYFKAWTQTMNFEVLASSETRRRRSALACNTCRGRRTKCDGKRPRCSFCAERGKDCFYQEAQDLPSSPLRAELSRLWEQLDNITAVVQGPPARKSRSRDARQGSGSPATQQGPSEFPFMILQSKQFMDLGGLDPSLAVLLEQIERERRAITVQESGVNTPMVDLEEASRHLHAFEEHVLTWYPVLHSGYTDDLIEATNACFPMSLASCLTLIVLAIGCAVEYDSVCGTRQEQSEAAYITAAMDMLPYVFADSSPSSAQCLLLFAIYHLCYAKPCQAHDFVAIASYKLQHCILYELEVKDDNAQKTLLANCFWSALLIESEITVQLDLPNSGIWSMAPFVPVPTSHTIRTWDPNPLSDRAIPSHDLSYFVAEIAMRNMLKRCTWATSTLAHGSHVYAPIVATELERQLDEWLQLLPSHLSFPWSSPVIGSHPWEDVGNTRSPQVAFLRAQYFAFKVSISWPAVYEALTVTEPGDELLRHSGKFFVSYAEFVPSAAAAVAVCRPNLWTLCTSVFTISMAALAGLTGPSLAQVRSLEVVNAIHLAVQIFDGVMQVSPSLAEMGAILKERAQLYHSS